MALFTVAYIPTGIRQLASPSASWASQLMGCLVIVVADSWVIVILYNFSQDARKNWHFSDALLNFKAAKGLKMVRTLRKMLPIANDLLCFIHKTDLLRYEHNWDVNIYNTYILYSSSHGQVVIWARSLLLGKLFTLHSKRRRRSASWPATLAYTGDGRSMPLGLLKYFFSKFWP